MKSFLIHAAWFVIGLAAVGVGAVSAVQTLQDANGSMTEAVGWCVLAAAGVCVIGVGCIVLKFSDSPLSGAPGDKKPTACIKALGSQAGKLLASGDCQGTRAIVEAVEKIQKGGAA